MLPNKNSLTTSNQPEFSQPDSGLVVPVFQKGDDLIDAINHMMSFLTAVVTSRRDKTDLCYLDQRENTTHWCKVKQTREKQRTVICYNCKGEGHIAKQCTKPKRKRDETGNLSRNGSDALTEVHNPDNLNYDLFNQSEQIMTSSEQSNDVSQTETEITSDSNIIPYSQYLSETQQETV
ncbi:retrovirus-related pol polyprotein from transposon TNT 1-94 [Tanacetum coccineum]